MFRAEAGQTVIWAPQPGPQTALLECPVFEVFYGGARGGGKTESSIGDWLQHSSLYGEHAVGIFSGGNSSSSRKSSPGRNRFSPNSERSITSNRKLGQWRMALA